jgi:uncharacterized membrane protein
MAARLSSLTTDCSDGFHRSPSPGLEWIVAGVVLIFGLGFVFLMPPCQTPDEPAHFVRAYHVSEGNLFPEMVENCGGGVVPQSLLQITPPFGPLALHPENQTSLECFAGLWSLPLEPEVRQPTTFPHSSYYSFVPYLPQALAMALARALGLGALWIFYAGRLGNLALSVGLVFAAVRHTPIGTLVFTVVALVPMTVHQFASNSPDASSIGVAFVLSAMFLRLAVTPTPRVTWPTLVALFVTSGWLTLCKFPYGAMTLLFLAIPVARLGGLKRYLTVGVALMLLVASLGLLQTQLQRFISDGLPLPGRTSSIHEQLSFIRHEPLAYLRVVAETTVEHGRIWMDQLGMLGWLDTYVNPMAMHLLFILAVIMALAEPAACGFVPSTRLRFIAFLSTLLCGLVVLTAVYVTGIAVRAPLMVGIQGRYFLPIIPLLLLSLPNRMIVVRAQPYVLHALAVGMGSGVLVIAMMNTLRRYYYPRGAQVWMSPLALGAGVSIGVILTFLVIRCSRPAREASARELDVAREELEPVGV